MNIIQFFTFLIAYFHLLFNQHKNYICTINLNNQSYLQSWQETNILAQMSEKK